MSTANDATVYELVGGDQGVRQLVRFFYQEMDRQPSAKVIREMHPQSLDESEEKLYWFLSGWMGGPQLYWEKRGHPMLRARHLPFPIGRNEADLWIECFRLALKRHLDSQPAWASTLADTKAARAKLESELLQALQRVALHMMNQPAVANTTTPNISTSDKTVASGNDSALHKDAKTNSPKTTKE
ncbi:MAG TPA: group II truncated hemoglobin [Pseudobdellovibrionaceae bacterium]|nr:group II truncated hemoglobin [Pseudobdellovibrionaceae bacterium]